VHIANAHGRPVVGLYAVAPASRTGPYGNTIHCVDCFDEAIRTLQGRDPATVAWAHRVHDPRAMSLISVEAVLQKIEGILGPAA
jgi:heptosyltransferase I